MNIDIRKYIIGNFKNNTTEDIKQSIETSIDSKEEDPLLGMGVLFELAWINSKEQLSKNFGNLSTVDLVNNEDIFLQFC